MAFCQPYMGGLEFIEHTEGPWMGFFWRLSTVQSNGETGAGNTGQPVRIGRQLAREPSAGRDVDGRLRRSGHPRAVDGARPAARRRRRGRPDAALLRRRRRPSGSVADDDDDAAAAAAAAVAAAATPADGAADVVPSGAAPVPTGRRFRRRRWRRRRRRYLVRHNFRDANVNVAPKVFQLDSARNQDRKNGNNLIGMLFFSAATCCR